MKKKAQRSKRNRHTGRINAFKKMVLDDGKPWFGGTHKILSRTGSSIVRIPTNKYRFLINRV